LARQQPAKPIDLARDCPTLWSELKAQHLLAAFEPALQNKASLAQLEFLARSEHRLGPVSEFQKKPLDRLLADIVETTPKDTGSESWQAFLKWLDSLKSGSYEGEYQWFLNLMQAIKPSEHTILMIIYGLIAVLVILSAWLVISELYVAGFFATLTGKHLALTRTKPSNQPIAGITALPQTVHELPPHRQIAVLLEQIIIGLVGRGLLPHDASFTYQQMVVHLFHQPPQSPFDPGPTFAQLVQTAEPILYGNRPVNSQMLADYHKTAQALLAKTRL
jgi:hypothetical protein